MLHSNTLECLLLNKCHGWKQYVLYVDIHNKYIVAIKFAKLIAASNHGGNKNFFKLFKKLHEKDDAFYGNGCLKILRQVFVPLFEEM